MIIAPKVLRHAATVLSALLPTLLSSPLPEQRKQKQKCPPLLHIISHHQSSRLPQFNNGCRRLLSPLR